MCRKCCQKSCNIRNNNCNCPMYRPDVNTSSFPENYMLGHAYTPVQNIQETFTPCNGLANGTMFPELVSHYEPGDSIEFINYLKNQGGGCFNDCE